MTDREQLEHAEGFGVECESGRIGSVAAVVPGVTPTLLVHTGGSACTLASVPFDDIAQVDVGARRVVLRGRGRQPKRSGRRTPVAAR